MKAKCGVSNSSNLRLECGLIAAEGITITDIVSTYTELVLMVREEDSAKTYNILFDSITKTRRSELSSQ